MGYYIKLNQWSGSDKDIAVARLAKVFKFDHDQAARIMDQISRGETYQFERTISDSQSAKVKDILTQLGFEVELISKSVNDEGEKFQYEPPIPIKEETKPGIPESPKTKPKQSKVITTFLLITLLSLAVYGLFHFGLVNPIPIQLTGGKVADKSEMREFDKGALKKASADKMERIRKRSAASPDEAREIEKVFLGFKAATKKVIADNNLEHWLPFLPPNKRAQLKKQNAASPESKENIVSYVKATDFDSQVVEILVNNDKALLLAEGIKPPQAFNDYFNETPEKGWYVFKLKPFDWRVYAVGNFVRIDGKWYQERVENSPYRLLTEIFYKIGDNKIDKMVPAYHCDLKKNATACDGQNPSKREECRKCFAKLYSDETLCLKGHEGDYCLLEVATKRNDPGICDMISKEKLRNQCHTMAYSEDLVSTVYVDEIDTDGDGLDTFREILFNTSIANPDTDGDGVNDYEEVMVNMTNPLGEGKLGDHIVPDL